MCMRMCELQFGSGQNSEVHISVDFFQTELESSSDLFIKIIFKSFAVNISKMKNLLNFPCVATMISDKFNID